MRLGGRVSLTVRADWETIYILEVLLESILGRLDPLRSCLTGFIS